MVTVGYEIDWVVSYGQTKNRSFVHCKSRKMIKGCNRYIPLNFSNEPWNLIG